MREFVGYYRVSTSRQGQSGLGLEAQREAVRRHVTSVSGVLIAEHTEIESGKVSRRPVLARALAECRQQKATLVIAKLDRLARNVAFVSGLMEAGTDFIALDAPYANKLLLHVLSAVAEHEREMISQRTKAALAAAKARGVELGKYGKVLAATNRSAAMAFAEALRPDVGTILSNGAGTLKEIAEGLNDLGHLTPEGAHWGPASVHRTMKRLGMRTAAMGPA